MDRIQEAMAPAAACLRAGDLNRAKKICRRLLAQSADQAGVLYNLGLLYNENGHPDTAIGYFQAAIRQQPEKVACYNGLGLAYQAQGHFKKARACFKTILERVPADPVAHFNLAGAHRNCGQMVKAITHLEKALGLAPDFYAAYHNLGELLGKLGRYGEAAEKYRQALRVKPDAPESWNGLGNALTNLGQTGEATDCFKRAIGLRPEYAGAYTNLGIACYEARQLSLAEKCYRQALELDAGLVEAEFNLGLVHLLKGDLEKGWAAYEKRFSKSDWAANYPFRLDRPRWDGRPFKGQRLLIHDEQGLGDTLQFVRYLERVKSLGGEVLLETRKPFLKLLENIRGVDQLVERSQDGRPRVEFDLYCPLLSLPMIFSTTRDSVPAPVPYIRADPEKAAQWTGRLDAQAFKIGLVWSGNPTHFRGLNRSAALGDFEALLRTPGVRFYGFQKGEAAREAEAFVKAGLLENLGEDFTDFSDTAAAMENMDLVISIDTSVAHLAGAMGKPAWVLLNHAADWRWLLDRSDSPWYPTMRLFRQGKHENWIDVLESIRNALSEVITKP